MAEAVCAMQGWQLSQARFYTGIPSRLDDPFRHGFWVNKLLTLSRQGVATFSRELRYRNKTVRLPNGDTHVFQVGEEKGVDVRISLDVIRSAHQQAFDVALVFSQDQDFSEVATEIRQLSKDQGRWIKMACAFPVSPTSKNTRGINQTDWIKLDRAFYDSCIDPHNYRPKKEDLKL